MKYKLGCDVNFIILVDKLLLGGVFVYVGDMVIDVLVCGKFVKLVEKLNFWVWGYKYVVI